MSKPFLLSPEDIKKILLEQNYVSQEDLLQAQQYAHIHNTSLVDYLVNQNILTHDLLGQAIAESFGVPYIDFEAHPMSKEKASKINKDVAETNRVVVVEQTAQETVVATDNPKQKSLSTQLKTILKTKKISIGYALPEAIDNALLWYRPSLTESLKTILDQNNEDALGVIQSIFEDAMARRASDIHFEPHVSDVVVRFRVDGVLETVATIDTALYGMVLNRIKVSSGLRIDEHFGAQDGSLHTEINGQTVDMRISIVPTTEGEKVVIRLLGEYVRGLALSEIGMNEHDQDLMSQMIRKPFGMILVVGPTGSGKTTTLYSLVKMLHKPGVNITTIEDPVEYKIPGINQIQVNEQTGLTFAKGLRSVVRQDPDIILIGEIRDRETAEIAVNAALTGHLVLSTFHANDASTAIPRLLDMGIEPFLLASTLELVVGQRLVRTLRKDARVGQEYSQKQLKENYPELLRFISSRTTTLYHASPTFNQHPFAQRTAVFELLPVDQDIQRHVMQSSSAQKIWQTARKAGVRSMFEDGVEKLKLGFTTPEELLRVVEPPQDE